MGLPEPHVRSFLASAVDMDAYIDSVVSTCDYVAAKRRLPKGMKISFDEWNVWYQSHHRQAQETMEWTEAPGLLQDRYTVADAVVVGDMLLSLLRHADRVGVACQAQLVNVIAPIIAEQDGAAWVQTIFHPLRQAAQYAKGTVLQLAVDSPRYETDVYGDVEAVSVVATYDEESGDVAVFLVNRDPDSALPVDVDLRSLGAVRFVAHQALSHDDPHTRSHPDTVDSLRPRQMGTTSVGDDLVLHTELAPASWNVVRLSA